MKKHLVLGSLLLLMSNYNHTVKLNSPLLEFADKAGLFNGPIVDILNVRQQIKNFIFGKYIWSGLELSFFNSNFTALLKRPETVYGITFVTISPDDQKLYNFVTSQYKDAVDTFVQKRTSLSLFQRLETMDSSAVFTGSYVSHPLTSEKLPVFVADNTLDYFDTRTTGIHLGVPAHDQRDFIFAKQHKLPVKLVVSALYDLVQNGVVVGPSFNKNGTELTEAYTGEYDECIIINSELLNGPIRKSADRAMNLCKEKKCGKEFKQSLLYTIQNKPHSLNDLQTIEEAFLKEGRTISQELADQLSITIYYAQADLLSFVEQFLVNAKGNKEMIVELIQESCKLRNNLDCYILRWCQLDSSEPESVIFKRDIKTFTMLSKFCSDLVDFLGDFASSCTHALENLKNLKNNR